MTDVLNLAAHDPMPGGRSVVVLRRFEEDGPAQGTVQIVLTGATEETTRPRRPDGTPMALEEAVDAAKRVAESEGLHRVYVLDRLAGERERDILSHSGDHSVHGEALADSDPEDGVRGSDMRDIAHPVAE